MKLGDSTCRHIVIVSRLSIAILAVLKGDSSSSEKVSVVGDPCEDSEVTDMGLKYVGFRDILKSGKV